MEGASWYYVEVTIRLGGTKTQSIYGPTRNTEAEAKQDLKELQEKLGTGEWINLDWLSADPEHVIAAHISGGGFAIS